MDELSWLEELASVADHLPREARPRPYWSQRRDDRTLPSLKSREAATRRARQLVDEMLGEHFFAETLGYDCVDGNGDHGTSPQDELDRRVGKPHLWDVDTEEWDEDDMCDFVEVFHDLASRPTGGWFHSYGGCGWHPSGFNRRSGQALYRWRMNEVLNNSVLDVRIADAGEDIGRMVRVAPHDLGELVDDVLNEPGPERDELAHAIALFRSRSSTREERRSAVVGLARILEGRRALLKEELLTKDEGDLFSIANRFDLRHKRADQKADYADEYLEWIFYWYLSTVRLTDQLLTRQEGAPA